LYKHIIWDFDGTLFDTYPVMGSIFKKMLEEERIVESLDEILKHMKESDLSPGVLTSVMNLE